MKNTFFILVATLLLAVSAQAQKKKPEVKPVQVPENIITTFKNQYPNTIANQWNKNYSGNYVASFSNAGNQKQVVEYSASGTLIKSKTTMGPDGLSENIFKSVADQYPNARFMEADLVQVPGVDPYFRVIITTADNKNKELFISEEGTITE